MDVCKKKAKHKTLESDISVQINHMS